MEPSPGTYIKLGVFTVFFIAGFVGNLLTIVVICRKRRRKSVYQMLVLNLAISDFLFIIFALPMNAYELFKVIPKSEFYCKVLWPLITVLYFLSILTITAMALQRCHTMVKPYHQKIGPKMSYGFISGIWFLSIVLVLPLSVVTTQVSLEECHENWPSIVHRQTYTVALFLLQYLIPLIIIAIAYAKIAIYLCRRVPLSDNIRTQEQGVMEARRRKRRIQAIRTLAAVVILFAICLFPGQVAWMLIDFGKGGKSQRKAVNILMVVSSVLDNFHACLNPIIYCVLNEQYRKEYIKLICPLQRNNPN